MTVADENKGREPTHGMDAHRPEARAFFTAVPDQHLGNRPYKTLFGEGDWTRSIAHFTGTMQAPMRAADATEIPPTGKSRHQEAVDRDGPDCSGSSAPPQRTTVATPGDTPSAAAATPSSSARGTATPSLRPPYAIAALRARRHVAGSITVDALQASVCFDVWWTQLPVSRNRGPDRLA